MTLARPLSTRPKPVLHTIGDGHYVLEGPSGGIQLEASQVRRDRGGELRCLLAVRSALAGAMELDDAGTLAQFDAANLSNPARRRELAGDLSRRSKTSSQDLDWRVLLDDLAFQISKAEATGQPAEWLGDIAPATAADRVHDVHGFPLLAHHPTILFGDGGTLKSYIALYLAGELARRGIPTMYNDWELDGADHRVRAGRIWGGEIPRLLYVRCVRPLVHEVDRLAHIKHVYGVQFAVNDSIAFGSHGKPEDAETAKEFFRALRSLGLGSLNIAHTTKAGDFSEHRPFGSAFWHNGTRSSWFAKAEDEQTEGTSRTVVLVNRKTNLGPRQSALAYRFEFGPDSLRIIKADPASVDSLADVLPIWQRIKSAVSHGPLTVAEIAEETGIKEDTVRKNVTRRPNLFLATEGANGVKKVALLERRAS